MTSVVEHESGTKIEIQAKPEARRLSFHQEELHRALTERDSLVAKIYMGALNVMGQLENPDRLALCAHNIREVMDRLARTSDTPITKKGPDTNSLIQPIGDAWEKLVQGNCWPGNPPWDGKINPALKSFLLQCETHIPKIKESRKKARDQASDIIESHNFHELSLPNEILESRSTEWMTYRKVFVRAAHHDPIEEEQLRHWLTLFEEFLLNLIRPRTFADQKRIQNLIEEAERAKS